MTSLTKGILLVCFSVFSGALMALFYKLTYADLTIYDRTLARGLLSLAVCLIVITILRKKNKANPPAYFAKRGNEFMMFVRCSMGFIGVLSYVYCVDTLSLADADMMTKLTAIFIIPFGALFFKQDKINKVQVLVVFISIIGAIFIIKPSFNNPLLFSYAIGILCAVTAALAALAIRCLVALAPNPENPITVESSLALFMVVACLYPSIRDFQGFNSDPHVYLFLFLSSAFGVIAQYTFSFAFKYAPAVEVNVYQYSSLLWSSLFGFIFFSFVPDWRSILGYFCIVGGGIILYLYNLSQSRKNTRPLS
ncbi:hypothetical protein CJP74_01500 [Psittacicella melopsittaci]|uniref:EamA domain-containing protein n=1 Tax=Psittacicella melopsittaci TaxID=2028576 RepID=A0A3A1YBT5_9GAMM|nr:DMT family transporter [Psittacicella melopsittaci]RIY33567.1 hypothetical protein CJP74_01500 [Psittacicella melopsittaci]